MRAPQAMPYTSERFPFLLPMKARFRTAPRAHRTDTSYHDGIFHAVLSGRRPDGRSP